MLDLLTGLMNCLRLLIFNGVVNALVSSTGSSTSSSGSSSGSLSINSDAEEIAKVPRRTKGVVDADAAAGVVAAFDATSLPARPDEAGVGTLDAFFDAAAAADTLLLTERLLAAADALDAFAPAPAPAAAFER